MNAPHDSTAPKGRRGWWASPPRSGMQRMISPWEYRHLRFWAGVRAGAGIVLVGLGIVTLSIGGNDGAKYGWALVFLALAATVLSHAYWDITIARSASARN